MWGLSGGLTYVAGALRSLGFRVQGLKYSGFTVFRVCTLCVTSSKKHVKGAGVNHAS